MDLQAKQSRDALAQPRPGFPYGEVFKKLGVVRSARLFGFIKIRRNETAVIRRYKPTDSDREIYKLRVRAFGTLPALGYPILPYGKDPETDVNKFFMAGRNDFVVAEVPRKILGIAFGVKIIGTGALRERKDLPITTAEFRGQDVVEFVKLCVHPEYFGNGLSREIRNARITIAQKHGYTAAYSDTSTLQAASLHLHRTEGWEQFGEVDTKKAEVEGVKIIRFKRQL